MEEKHKCPVCGQYEFEEWASFDTCPICGWKDDAVQNEHADFTGCANHMSLNQAKEAYAKGEKIN